MSEWLIFLLGMAVGAFVQWRQKHYGLLTVTLLALTGSCYITTALYLLWLGFVQAVKL